MEFDLSPQNRQRGLKEDLLRPHPSFPGFKGESGPWPWVSIAWGRHWQPENG
jgi:hypothetical protein